MQAIWQTRLRSNVKYEHWWFMRNPAWPTRFHISIFHFSTFKYGARVGAVGWGTELQAWWVRFPMMSLEFFIDKILPATFWLLGCNRNEYQEYFLGGKCGRCVILTTLPFSWDHCLEIWEPQSPGTLRVCPGLYSDCFTFAIKLNGTTTFLTRLFMCRNEVFLTTGIVNRSHRTRKILLQNCSTENGTKFSSEHQ
jgi:hypothetical protein